MLTPAQAHARFEKALLRAMRSADPVASLQRSARDRQLPAALRGALRAADADGLRLAALLVARLRFERLLRGCPEAEAWFEEDGASFAGAFRRYHEGVPATAFFPPAEARLFRRWAAREGVTRKGPPGRIN